MGYARLAGAAAAAALCVWTFAAPAQTEEPAPDTLVVAQADVPAAPAPSAPVDPLPAMLTPAQARGLLIALMLQVPGAFEATLEEVTEGYSPNASE